MVLHPSCVTETLRRRHELSGKVSRLAGPKRPAERLAVSETICSPHQVMDEEWDKNIPEYGAINITGFRLVDPQRPRVKAILRRWQGQVGRKKLFSVSTIPIRFFFTIRYKIQFNLMLSMIMASLNRRKQCSTDVFVICSMTSEK